MSTSNQPSAQSRPGPRVRIVDLDGPVFDALAAGDLAAANKASPVPLSDYFTVGDRRGGIALSRGLAPLSPDPPMILGW